MVCECDKRVVAWTTNLTVGCRVDTIPRVADIAFSSAKDKETVGYDIEQADLRDAQKIFEQLQKGTVGRLVIEPLQKIPGFVQMS